MAEAPGQAAKMGGIADMASGASGALSGISNFIGAFSRSALLRAKGRMERNRREYNAALLNLQAEDVLEAADQVAEDYMVGVGEMVSTQKAAFAAQNVRLGTGVTKRVETETRHTARKNLARLRNKANAEASGIRTQAAFQRMAGIHAQREFQAQAKMAFISGITGGTSQVAGAVASFASGIGAFTAPQPGDLDIAKAGTKAGVQRVFDDKFGKGQEQILNVPMPTTAPPAPGGYFSASANLLNPSMPSARISMAGLGGTPTLFSDQPIKLEVGPQVQFGGI